MWSVVSKTGLCNGVEARDERCWPMLAFSIVAVLCIVKVGAECSHIRASFFGHRAAARVAAKGFKMTGGGEREI